MSFSGRQSGWAVSFGVTRDSLPFDQVGYRCLGRLAVSSILGRYCCVLGFGRLYLARPPVGTGYLGILWSATSSASARQVSVLASLLGIHLCVLGVGALLLVYKVVTRRYEGLEFGRWLVRRALP